MRGTINAPRREIRPGYNLLDNGDFAIAQAGYGAMHGSVLYACDRWYDRYGFGAFTKTGQGLNMAYGTNHAYICQKIAASASLVGKKVTFAVKVADGDICLCSGIYTGTQQDAAANFNGADGEISIRDGYVQVIVTAGAATILWAALYEGEYTASTLPTYVQRPYAVELSECQRYYQVINVFMSDAFDANGTATATIPFMTTMRIIPSISFVTDESSDGVTGPLLYRASQTACIAGFGCIANKRSYWYGRAIASADL